MNNLTQEQHNLNFDGFLLGCIPLGTVAPDRTNAFKDMVRITKGCVKGNLNSSLYKNFIVIDSFYSFPQLFQFTMVNKLHHRLMIDETVLPYFKNWCSGFSTEHKARWYLL